MVCIHCGSVIEEKDKIWMIRNGEWIAEEETDIDRRELEKLLDPHKLTLGGL